MKKIAVALLGLSALGAVATMPTGANAMPVTPLSGVSSGAQQVRYVCDAWGRCWWRPNYYAPRHYAPRYYGPRYYAPRPYYGGPRFHGGWRHRW